MVPLPCTLPNPVIYPVAFTYDTPSECWYQSDRADWLLALLQHAWELGISDVIRGEDLRRFACWCARSVGHLHQVHEGHVALQAAEHFLDEPTTLRNLEQAWAESYVRSGAGIRRVKNLCDWVRTAAVIGACTESANPDPLTAAKRAAEYAALAQVWDRVRTSELPHHRGHAPLFGSHPWSRVYAAYQAGEPLGYWQVCHAVDAAHVQWSELVTAARHQVNREILAAQAAQLRTWVSGPFGASTWAQLPFDGDVEHDSTRCNQTTASSVEASVGQGPWTWERKWCVRQDRRILYGLVDGGLVFIPVNKAERQVGIYTALAGARTWGEFRRSLPDGVYEELIDAMIADNRGVDRFYQSWLEEGRDGGTVQAFREYTALPFHDRLPDLQDAFDSTDIPGLCDGDWPDWPQQHMLNWVPTEIQTQYGQRASSNFNGDCLLFSADHEVELVQAFRAAGYHCQRADWFVRRACGYRA